MKDSNKKNRLFKLFTPKPITKDDEFAEIPTNFKGFFVMLGRKFWNISNLSLLYSFVNLPILFLFLAFALRTSVSVVSSPMTAAFYGFWQVSESPVLASIYPFVSNINADATVPSVGTYICYGIAALFILTFGISNAGAAYVIRAYNRGDPVFLISDYFGAIKRNWKQATLLGIIDLLFCFILFYDYTFWLSMPGFFNSLMTYFALFLCALYFIMRFYIYTISITFDLSFYKILKDAFLLTFLGLKRNLAAFFGIIFVLFLNFLLLLLYIPIGIIFPIILTLGLVMFISGYASWPVIKKYMIDPFYPEESEEDDSSDDDEPVFEDRG